MRVALLRGRLGREETHHPSRPQAARSAQVAVAVGLDGEVTTVTTVSVQIDAPSAAWAVTHSVPVLGASHRDGGTVGKVMTVVP